MSNFDNQVEKLWESKKLRLKEICFNFLKILSTNFSRKCMEASLESLYGDGLSPKSDQHQTSPCNISAL